MTKEELVKEAKEKYIKRLKQNGCNVEYKNETYIDGYLDSAEPREKLLQEKNKKIAELESQLSLKIINCIKSHLCKQDEDYDKAIISPKFLSDTLDQMYVDGFEEIKENE